LAALLPLGMENLRLARRVKGNVRATGWIRKMRGKDVDNGGRVREETGGDPDNGGVVAGRKKAFAAQLPAFRRPLVGVSL
jgi:hypothetical protein